MFIDQVHKFCIVNIPLIEPFILDVNDWNDSYDCIKIHQQCTICVWFCSFCFDINNVTLFINSGCTFLKLCSSVYLSQCMFEVSLENPHFKTDLHFYMKDAGLLRVKYGSIETNIFLNKLICFVSYLSILIWHANFLISVDTSMLEQLLGDLNVIKCRDILIHGFKHKILKMREREIQLLLKQKTKQRFVVF